MMAVLFTPEIVVSVTVAVLVPIISQLLIFPLLSSFRIHISLTSSPKGVSITRHNIAPISGLLDGAGHCHHALPPYVFCQEILPSGSSFKIHISLISSSKGLSITRHNIAPICGLLDGVGYDHYSLPPYVFCQETVPA